MKKLITILIVGIGAVMLATGLAFSEDVTAHIGGTRVNALAITSSDLSYADTGREGDGTAFEMSGSPIEGTIVNNGCLPALDGEFLKVKMLEAPESGQYDNGSGGAYYLWLGPAIWTPADDNEAQVFQGNSYTHITTDNGSGSMLLHFDAGADEPKILHGSFTQEAYVLLNTYYHIKGNTNDNITLQYTLIDFAE